MQVFAVFHFLTDEERAARPEDGTHELQGIFSSREGAAAICTTENDQFVTFELDRDYTNERTFEVTNPVAGFGPEPVTA